MLRVGRSWSYLSRVTTDFSPKNSINALQLRLWRPTIFKKYASVTNVFELDEAGNVKLRLDPRVDAVKDKLIYCDYIEKKRFKYGYKKNKLIENSFKKKMRQRELDEQMNTPEYSVALKYLMGDNQKVDDEKIDENQEKEMIKPIHMPYASTDTYEAREEIEEDQPDEQPDDSPLNLQYKKLYEKYLDAKVNTEMAPRLKRKMENLEKLIEHVESKQSTEKDEMKRPADKLNNIPMNWMTDYEQYDDTQDEEWETNYGTADSSVPISNIPCGGCGALLHCQDSAIPGYLPSELFKGLRTDDELRNTICQRCHFMKYYNTTLEVKVSSDAYPEILSQIQMKKRKVAVILMIDLTDFPCSIWPDLPSIIGKYTPIFVVGNKVDLLPKDCPQFLNNVKNSLMKELEISGIRQFNIKHVELISAQTGYGVERLIHQLYKIWEYKGDVYMIGCTNVGKSTLFNALLQSDYCKVHAVDLIRRATTSPWPGTTLNLLKFPILNPVKWRMALRAMRRKHEMEEQRAELEFRKRQLTAERDISFATLQERIGRTFSMKNATVQGPAHVAHERRKQSGLKFGINERDVEYRLSRWCYDTPGVVHPDQIIHLLTTEELLLTLSNKIISPRSFIFKPGQTLFLAGLGRLDLVECIEFIRITVFASSSLPITICKTDEADEIYNELLQTDALAVPVNDPERLKIWPHFEHKNFDAEGINENESVCDIILSSAGWIAITPKTGDQIKLKAWTPEGRGIYQRTPALLAKSVTHRGARIKSTAAYRCGRQVYTGH